MMNLAGHPDPDPIVECELTRCRIEIVRGDKQSGEVATSLTGRLNHLTFRRAWRYWVVDGRIPLHIAKALYSDPVGGTDIRVAGHCACPAPGEYGTEWIDSEGRRLLKIGEREESERLLKSESETLRRIAAEVLAENQFVEDPSAVGIGFVTTYHIDSEVGLRVFADAVRGFCLEGRFKDSP